MSAEFVDYNYDKILIECYVNLLWGEFNQLVRGRFFVVPLFAAFAVIEASAKLTAPPDMVGRGMSQERFCWWVKEFLHFNDGLPYPALDLYGSRCGLLHGFESGSDLYDAGRVSRIVWTRGEQRQHHGASKDKVIIFSEEQFFDDLNNAGIAVLRRLNSDMEMNRRFAERSVKLFGLFPA